MQLTAELQTIGLNEKEAKVYLACLALGSATAQNIAAKAVVNRPTTYVMIESLIKRGLVNSFEKGKKRFFAAAPPIRLQRLLVAEREELEEKERTLKSIIAGLRDMSAVSDTPPPRIFEGRDGLEALREELSASEGEACEILSSAEAAAHSPLFGPGSAAKSRRKRRVRALFIGDAGAAVDWPGAETRRLNQKIILDAGGLVVCGDRVILWSTKPENVYNVFINKQVSALFRAAFALLWEPAQ